MYLFDNKGSSIDIYDFKASQFNLSEYRTHQMLKIPEDRRVFRALTKTDAWGDAPLLEGYLGDHFNDRVLDAEIADNKKRYRKSLENGFGRYHVITNDGIKQKERQRLVEDYCLGCFPDRRTVQIQYLEMMRYFLLVSKKYLYLGENYGKSYELERMIQLPESLHSLQLIEQGRFEALGDRDISEQLDLYSFLPVGEISTDELQMMDKYGLAFNAYDNVIKKAANDSYVLRRLKRK